MKLKMCILGSGSRGNCVYVGAGDVGVLIDAGLSARQIQLRLESIGVDPTQIKAICISHEHADHVAGVKVLHKRFNIPLYANAGTVEALRRQPAHELLPWRIFTTGSDFAIGDISIHPFSVPHDAMEPVGFILRHGDAQIGIATDLGMTTTLIRQRLRGCHALVIESNHDEELLQASVRPWSLKQRILGRQGHLSNTMAARAVIESADGCLARVYLAHLSSDCNCDKLARKTVEELLRAENLGHVEVRVTYPDAVSEWWYFTER
jgi:phosphoribosyl 1,2-cyclic phosphodiesterase